MTFFLKNKEWKRRMYLSFDSYTAALFLWTWMLMLFVQHHSQEQELVLKASLVCCISQRYVGQALLLCYFVSEYLLLIRITGHIQH